MRDPRQKLLRVVATCLLAMIASAALPAVYYADPSAIGANDGTSWQNAFTSLQAAVDAAGASGGGEVWAAKGVYTGTFPTVVTDSFEWLDSDAVDMLGEEADLRFTSAGGPACACHMTYLYLRAEVTQPGSPPAFPETTEQNTFTARLTDLLSSRVDMLVFANHPSVPGLAITGQDIADAANARALHAIDVRDAYQDIAKWDYALAHLDDQAGECNKILWALRSDDSHFIADVDFTKTGAMMGCIPTIAQDSVYADRRLAFRDMIRRGSFVSLPPNSRCGMPSYSLQNSGGTASRMQVSVYMDNIGGAASANIRFYGCDYLTGNTPGTLLFGAPLTLNSDNTASYYLTTNGLPDGEPLTATQKANIKYIRPVVTWSGGFSRSAYLMPVRIRSNGDWWNGPAYELAGNQAVIGPSPYPSGGADTGETVYFNTHCHTTASDGDSPAAAMRARYWENYGLLDPGKPRFAIVTDHNRRTPFSIPVGEVVMMKPDVHMYGGFAGWETARGQRDWMANRSIIDAEAKGRCVTVDGTGWPSGTHVTIDGLTLREGRAISGYGGGLYAVNSSPEIDNCSFSSNVARAGGGLCASHGTVTRITDCAFTGNSAVSCTDGGGGALLLDSNAVLSGCDLSGNSSIANGGGLSVYGSCARISDCLLRANSGNRGGGLSIGNSDAHLSNCTLSLNTADSGAGIEVGYSNLNMTGCSANGNTAGRDGGGVLLYESGSVFDSCVFEDNEAGNGAGMFSTSSCPVVRNCIYAGNQGNEVCGRGGAIYSEADVYDSLYANNTMVENTARYGGGIYISGSSSTWANNAVAFNSEGIHASNALAILHHNDVFGNGIDYTGTLPGTGDISADPLFRDRASGDLHLAAGSPCIDAAVAVPNSPLKDMDEQYRTWGSGPDIGADEFWPFANSPRLLADGEPVDWYGAIVVAAFSGVLYVESDDRAYGMRVDKVNHGLQPGQRANTAGVIRTNSDGERYIDAASATANGSGTVSPLLLPNRSIGGGDWIYDSLTGAGQKGIAGASDPNTIGLLVCTTGLVTYACPEFFYVDDGSALRDGSGHTGIRVLPCGQTVPDQGSNVRVTGASSCFKADGALQRLIRASAVLSR